MGKHLKEQHEGKNILSPERKLAKIDHKNIKEKEGEGEPKEVEENKMDTEEKIVTIKLEEYKNLQDLLVQTGQEKEEISLRLANSNHKIFDLEKTNNELTQETCNQKVENKKSVKNVNNLDKECNIKMQDMKQVLTHKDKEIKDLQEKVEKLESAKALKEIETGKCPRIKDNKKTPTLKPIPKHLTPVQTQHLKDLNGICMKCNGNPGGDCLSSCTTIHLSNTNDRHERRRVNRRINHHIADNFDTFYVNKISLPYSETIGVGSNAKQIICKTSEEFLNFLRSEDSLCTYSNYQELLAISNLLNIQIHIFTYGIGGDEASWSWNTVVPDPEMVESSEFSPGTVPDMFLYNSDNNHFDLLVEDISRLAVSGLITMSEERKDPIEKDVTNKDIVEKDMTQKDVAHKEGPDTQEEGENNHGEGNAYQGQTDTEEVEVETEGEEEETNNWKTVNGRKYKCLICNQTCNT